MSRNQKVEETITAQNTFTEPLKVSINKRYSLTISGTFDATITLQKTYDSGTTWFDVERFVGPDSDVSIEVPENLQVRIGVKTGEFVSGSAYVRLGGE